MLVQKLVSGNPEDSNNELAWKSYTSGFQKESTHCIACFPV